MDRSMKGIPPHSWSETSHAHGYYRKPSEPQFSLLGYLQNSHSAFANISKRVSDEWVEVQQAQQVRRLTQTEMAALVGSTREVVGRVLKESETAGAIEMRHGQAVVLNRERLRMITL